MEELVILAVEVAGGIGMDIMATNVALKAAPKGLKTAEKVCVGIGAGMATIAAEQIVTRECERYYRDFKREVIKPIGRAFKKNKHHKGKHHNNYKKKDYHKKEEHKN